MPSNAAKEWSGTFKELVAKRDKLKRQIRYHLEQHKKLDEQANADEVRKARHQQSIDTLNKAHEKITVFLKTASPRMGQGKRSKEVKSNITDNQSAKMTTSKGTIQGYNGVAAVDKKHQIIVDAQVFGEGQEHHTLQPIPALPTRATCNTCMTITSMRIFRTISSEAVILSSTSKSKNTASEPKRVRHAKKRC